jgi:isopentenyl diphosphate isomerase/L-lactate dehydrogenase-like FMN-dependent dehydrogenase
MSSGLEEELQALHEVVEAAHRNLPRNIWGYLIGGTETETTVQRNRHALDSLAFRPRVLRDVSKIDTSGTLFGKPARLPVALAPIGSLESFEAGGGATAAKAAAQYGVPMFLSSVTKPGLEAVAEAAPDARKIFQLYVRGDDAFVDDYARRAKDCGYEAFCITVDTAIYSRRERDVQNRFVKPWRTRAVGQDYQAALSWDNIKRFKDKHDIPLILKGIGTAEDAAAACALGVEGVYVSNHGGRQLDHGRGSMNVLPEVVDAVGGRAQVIVDGSFSRGTDILKALALGADFVVIGRLFCYGLAASGQAGVARVLELLEEEVRESLGLLGAASFSEVDKGCVVSVPAMVTPHVHSAFPLLRLSEKKE